MYRAEEVAPGLSGSGGGADYESRGGTPVSTRRVIRAAAVMAVVLGAGLAIAACGRENNDNNNDNSSTSSSSGGGGSGSIALLLPESQTARYESQDRPLFEKKVKQLC